MGAVDFEAGMTGLLTGVADLVTAVTDLGAEETGFGVDVAGDIDRTYTHGEEKQKLLMTKLHIP